MGMEFPDTRPSWADDSYRVLARWECASTARVDALFVAARTLGMARSATLVGPETRRCNDTSVDSCGVVAGAGACRDPSFDLAWYRNSVVRDRGRHHRAIGDRCGNRTGGARNQRVVDTIPVRRGRDRPHIPGRR